MKLTFIDLLNDVQSKAGLNNYKFELSGVEYRRMMQGSLYSELKDVKRVITNYEKKTGRKVYAEIDGNGFYFVRLD